MTALLVVLVWLGIVGVIAEVILRVVGASRLASWLRLPPIED